MPWFPSPGIRALRARLARCVAAVVSATASLAVPPAFAQAPAAGGNAGHGDYTFAISEGTSGGLDHARVIAKYGPLAEVIAQATRHKVKVVFAREFSQLEQGMRDGRFDLVMARPSDYPARGLRDHGYQFVASAKPEGQCLVITKQGSPVTDLAKARGLRWVLPEGVSFMSKFCAAELRDRGIDLVREKVQYVREQAAIPFFLDNGLADVGGIASYSGVARGLAKSGHVVVHRSVTQPYFPLVAGRQVPKEEVQAMQAALAALPAGESGRRVLKTIGIDGFDTAAGPRLAELLSWLGQ